VESVVDAQAHLLIVEDDPLIATYLTRGLGKHLKLTLVDSALPALKLFEEGGTFDLVLSDLHMPDLSGLELRRRVLALDPDMAAKFTFMTGGSVDPEAQDFLVRERDRCLDKPFTISQLRDFLRRQGLQF
jgi:two-component system NtrC family sensor kinase